MGSQCRVRTKWYDIPDPGDSYYGRTWFLSSGDAEEAIKRHANLRYKVWQVNTGKTTFKVEVT